VISDNAVTWLSLINISPMADPVPAHNCTRAVIPNLGYGFTQRRKGCWLNVVATSYMITMVTRFRYWLW